jgi:transposase
MLEGVITGQVWPSDEQVERLRPHFPKARGKPRVDDGQVLSGILHVLRNGLRWQDAPAAYGPHKTRLTTGSPGGRGSGCSPASFVTWLAQGLKAKPS